MSKMYSVTERRGTRNLQIRVYVPERYQSTFGKKEITRSLGTPDRRVANERAPAIAADILEAIKASQTRHERQEAPEFEPTGEQIDQAARYVYAALVRWDQNELLDVGTVEETFRGTPASAAVIRERAQEDKQAALRGDFRHTIHDHWAFKFGFLLTPGSRKERLFMQKLDWAYREAAQRWAEHDEDIFGREANNALFKGIIITGDDEDKFAPHPTGSKRISLPRDGAEQVAGAVTGSEGTQPPLMEIWPAYARQRGARASKATNDDKRRVLQMFADFVGPSRPLDSITKQDAIRWRDALAETPKSAAQRKVFEGKSPAEIIELNKQIGLPTMSPRTINKHISMVSAIYDWLVAEDRAPANIWKGLTIDIEDELNKRPPFTVEQLQAFFNTPLFIGCEGEEDIRKLMTPGPVQVRNWRFWAPLLAVFTGARQSELLQLELIDIRRADGVDYIYITDEGTDPAKRIKSRLARRSIPIHSRLLDLGFLTYVEALRQNGATRLFPEVQRNAKGDFNHAQRELNKAIKRMKFPPDEKGRERVFHSFRHNVIDELRRHRAPHEFQLLIGHAPSGTTRGYGVREDLGLKKRHEIIEAIRYAGLDLSRIKPFVVTDFAAMNR